MKDKQLAARTFRKGLSILLAVLFVFNLFAVVPLSAQHSKIEGVTHAVSTEITNSDQLQLKSQHDNVEHCGLASCTLAFQGWSNSIVVIDVKDTLFSALTKDLQSVSHPPLGRPPRV